MTGELISLISETGFKVLPVLNLHIFALKTLKYPDMNLSYE